MDYQKTYDSLIERGRNRVLKGYSERHHIVPKCMNGTDDKENLVHLTGEEHFNAHFLLAEIYPKNEGLLFAFMMMSGKLDGKEINAKEYERLREKYAKIVSERMSGSNNPMYGMTGENNPSFGRTGKNSPLYNKKRPEHSKRMSGENNPMYKKHHSDETKQKQSKIKSGKNNPMFNHIYTEESLEKKRRSIRCKENEIIYPSIKEAAEKLGLHASGISAVLSGRQKQTGGYYFEYVS